MDEDRLSRAIKNMVKDIIRKGIKKDMEKLMEQAVSCAIKDVENNLRFKLEPTEKDQFRVEAFWLEPQNPGDK